MGGKFSSFGGYKYFFGIWNQLIFKHRSDVLIFLKMILKHDETVEIK